MRIILKLALKDLRLLLADPVGLFFAIVFPILSASLFGLMYAGQSGGGAAALPVVVVDTDQSPASARLVSDLENDAGLALTRVRDTATAASTVRAGDAVAFIRVPQGFGAALAQPFWGGAAQVELAVDPSRPAERGMLHGVLMQHLFRGLQAELANTSLLRQNLNALAETLAPTGSPSPQAAMVAPFLKDLDRVLAHVPSIRALGGDSNSPFSEGWAPVKVEEIQLPSAAGDKSPTHSRSSPNSFAISFPQGTSWGVLGCAAAFAISLVVERRRGTLVRLRLAPIGRVHILAGKGLACFISIITVCTLLAAFGAVVFGVRPQSPFLLILAYVSIALCFVGIMMLLSVLGRTEAAAGGIGWSVLLILAMFGGGMMPLFLLPEWAQRLGSFSPVKWSILAMEGAIWREFDLTALLPICATLVTIGAAAFCIGVAIDRRLA